MASVLMMAVGLDVSVSKDGPRTEQILLATLMSTNASKLIRVPPIHLSNASTLLEVLPAGSALLATQATGSTATTLMNAYLIMVDAPPHRLSDVPTPKGLLNVRTVLPDIKVMENLVLSLALVT